MERIQPALLADLCAIKSKAPVILNLSNYVAMDLNANALLAIGASPIMAHAKEELSELVQIAGSIVINIGTLDPAFISQSLFVLTEAKKINKPVVFDPVGAGATSLRTEAAQMFINSGAITVLRGNVSEIAAILNKTKSIRGVDSSLSFSQTTCPLVEMTKEKSKDLPFVIAVSGEIDYVFFNGESRTVKGGSPMMTKVTGMGCTATALVGAFLAVNPSPLTAALHAMTVMGISGEMAMQSALGPGSFRTAFVDALASLGEYLS